MIHVFWGDERHVPPDHPDSNFGMTHAALLGRVGVPNDNVHAIPTVGLSPQAAAAAYETTLRDFYGRDRIAAARPLFDITLLGIGADGHTASLFPGHPALDERDHWSLAVLGAKAEARITLTYSALDSSRHVAFLVSGAEKHDGSQPAAVRELKLPHQFVELHHSPSPPLPARSATATSESAAAAESSKTTAATTKTSKAPSPASPTSAAAPSASAAETADGDRETADTS